MVYGDGDSYSTLNHYPPGTNPPVLVATGYGSGRVVALGREAYLSSDDYDGNGVPNVEDYDNLQLGLNIVDWGSVPWEMGGHTMRG